MFTEVSPRPLSRSETNASKPPQANDFGIQLKKSLSRYSTHTNRNSTLQLEKEKCDSIYCVLNGWLAMSKMLKSGQSQIIDFALPGDIVDPAAGDGVTSSVTVTALTDSRLAAMPYSSWAKVTRDWPELQRQVYLADAERNASRAERMLRLGKGTAEMRISYALLEFFTRLDLLNEPDSPEFYIPLTQQQIGDYVGLSSVHVCRTLRRLNRQGVIQTRDHIHIRILNARTLAKLAGADLPALRRKVATFRV